MATENQENLTPEEIKEIQELSKSLLSYDPDYVYGETCSVGLPLPLAACGRSAVAGIGIAEDSEMVHPTDRRAVTHVFFCDQHMKMLNEEFGQ